MDPKLLDALIAIAKLEAGEVQLRERIRQLEAAAMQKQDVNVQTIVGDGNQTAGRDAEHG